MANCSLIVWSTCMIRRIIERLTDVAAYAMIRA